MQKEALLPNEPILMQNQQLAFNGDNFVEAEFLRLKKKFKIKTVVETGTCVGTTAKWFGENFSKVFTVEVVEQYRQFALQRIAGLDNVTSLLGDSVEMMRSDILKNCDNDTLLFLDAHWGNFCPLREELSAVAEFKLKPVIVIHDFEVPGIPELGYDSIGDQPFTYEWLKDKFDDIYGENGYDHYYNSELDGANRGVIYVVPKTGNASKKKK